MNDEAYIGFDLGHGETAVSLSSPGARVHARNLTLTRGGNQVIPTVVATGPHGETLVGEDALLRLNATERLAAFKHPDVLRPEVRDPIVRFVRGVFAEMAACGTHVDGNLVFGHPSGWTSDQVQRYRQVLTEAVGNPPLMVPEARAAFLPLKSTGELSTAQINQGSIVIVDMGSSTTDFALVHGVGNPTDLGNPGGIQLGAGLIDLALLRLSLEDLAVHQRQMLQAFMEKHPSELTQVVLAFRQAKEKFFNRERIYRETGVGPVVDLESLPEQIGLRWAPRVTPRVMDQCLDAPLVRLGVQRDLYGRPTGIDRSWREEFMTHLQFAVDKLPKEPNIIVLTGGAANMGWVMDMVRAQYPAAEVIRPADPEHTIANGLALHGAALGKSTAVREEIDALVRSSEIEGIVASAWDDGVETLVTPLADSFVDRFVAPAIVDWRHAKVRTLDDIGTAAAKRAREWAESPDGRRAIGLATAKWYQEAVAPVVNRRVREICSRYPDIPSHAVEIPEDALRVNVSSSGGGSAVSAGMILADVDTALNAILVVVSSVIAMTLFGAGHALLLATGPVAVIVAAVAGAVALFIGKEEALKRARSWDMPPLMRRSFPEELLIKRVTSRAPRIEADIRRAMAEGLRTNEETRHRVAVEVGAVIDASLSQRIRDASAHLV